MIEAIRTHLLSVSAITAEISDRFDPFIRVEPGTDALPAVMYEVQSEEPLQGLAHTGLYFSTLQLTTISDRMSNADDVADLLEANLENHTSSTVQNCKLINVEREELQPIDGGEDYYFLTIQTWEIWHA